MSSARGDGVTGGLVVRACDKLLGIWLFRPPPRANELIVTAENDGDAAALFGDDAFSATTRLPKGGPRGLTRLEGFGNFETLRASAPSLHLSRPSFAPPCPRVESQVRGA